MDDKLESLSVQCKFRDVIKLEEKNKVWSRLVSDLPTGQLSFVLRMGKDVLPTPLNLKRWNYRTNPSCTLCSSNQPTSLHILNGCPEALNQGCFKWHHDSVLLCLLSSLTHQIPACGKMYVDIQSYRSSDSPPATILLKFSVTMAHPNMVLEVNERKLNILELTVCSNTNHGF